MQSMLVLRLEYYVCKYISSIRKSRNMCDEDTSNPCNSYNSYIKQ